jgi:hypothetical protein
VSKGKDTRITYEEIERSSKDRIDANHDDEMIDVIHRLVIPPDVEAPSSEYPP